MRRICRCFEKIGEWLRLKKKKNHISLKKYSKVDKNNNDSISPQQAVEEISNKYIHEDGNIAFIKPNFDNSTQDNLYITNCVNGRYYMLQGFQNTYIDDCKNTFLFIGPCKSTIFIRNCHNLKVRAISQQLRIQNSHQIEVEGIIGVNPVCENSNKIVFSSLSILLYDDLLWQIEQAKIDIFDNKVFECYDFTPKKVPSFQNQTVSTQMDEEWETRLSKMKLVGKDKIYLPQKVPIKSSMMKKIYTEKYLSSSNDIAIIFSKLSNREFLFNLKKSFPTVPQLLMKLKKEICHKKLLEYSDKGNWNFYLFKIPDQEVKMQEKVKIVRDATIIFELISQMLI